MPYLIVTPIQDELDLLVKYFHRQGFETENTRVGRLNAQYLPRLKLMLARGGLGKAQFGIQTQHLLDSCQDIQAVICAGAAGALAEHLRPGDVVIAVETVEHDCTYKFVKRPPPRFGGDSGLLQQLRRVTEKPEAFAIHYGVVASGDEDIVDRKRAEAISTQTGAIAVAWEGAGGARACAFNGVPYVEMRGISDAADPEAPADFEVNLEGVMEHVGWLILRWAMRQQVAPQP